jgi:hypothetical protein
MLFVRMGTEVGEEAEKAREAGFDLMMQMRDPTCIQVASSEVGE